MESLLSIEVEVGRDSHFSRRDVLRIIARLIKMIKVKGNPNKGKSYKDLIKLFLFLLSVFILYFIGAFLIYRLWGAFEDYARDYWIVATIGCLVLGVITDLRFLAFTFGDYHKDVDRLTISFSPPAYFINSLETEIRCPCCVIVDTPSKFLIMGVGAVRKKDLSESAVKLIQKIVKESEK